VNFRTLVDQAVAFAHAVGELLPPVEGGADIADKVLDVLDSLKDHAPEAASREQLEAAHAALLKRISDKGHALSDRLRGQ